MKDWSHRSVVGGTCAAVLWAGLACSAVNVAKFRGDRAGALSFTFDDGSQSHFDTVFPYLEEFGFKGSFYVIAGLTRDKITDPPSPDIPSNQTWAGVSWEEWCEVAAEGHEIGNHSMTHPHLS